MPADSAAAEDSTSPFHIGVDVVNRYVWRGKVYSDVANFQPHAAFDWKSLEFGTWGSYSVNGDWQEQDLALMYTLETPSAGSFVALLNDYFFPSYGGQYAKPFNYDGVKDGVGTGAHTLELMGSYSTPKVPLTFTLAWNFYNDPDHALYGETVLAPSFHGFDFTAGAGWALNTSAYYEAEKGDLVNLLASVKRSFKLHRHYSFYISAGVIRNPALGKTYSLFTLGL